MPSDWWIWVATVLVSALAGAVTVSFGFVGIAKVRSVLSASDKTALLTTSHKSASGHLLPAGDRTWMSNPLPASLAHDETVSAYAQATMRWAVAIQRWDGGLLAILDEMFPPDSLSWQKFVPIATESVNRLRSLVEDLRKLVSSVQWERHRHWERLHARGGMTDGSVGYQQMLEGRAVLGEMDSILTEGNALEKALEYFADQIVDTQQRMSKRESSSLVEEIERLAQDIARYAED